MPVISLEFKIQNLQITVKSCDHYGWLFSITWYVDKSYLV